MELEKLSALAVKQAKPKDKAYKIWDGGSLYLLVTTQGKYWRFNYRFGNKRKTLALGVYPDIALADARKEHKVARQLLAEGVDPNTHKQAKRAASVDALANSFEVVALEWLDKQGTKSKNTLKRQNSFLKNDLFPYLGKRPIGDIKAPELLKALRKIESRGAIETAHRAKQLAGQIFRYAVATGRADRDPSTDLKGALAQPIETHFKSLTEPNEIAPLMVAIHNYQGTPAVTAALNLSPLLFCRPGELRHLEWSEVRFESAQIELPATKMKMKQPHIIPLSIQAKQILEELRPITGRGKYVFPSARGGSRPLSDNGVRTALRTLGYTNEQISPHGFRAMARTILDEVLNFPVDWIEHQLAHSVKDPNGRAYNRTKHLTQRQKMMQTWADYLDGLASGHNNVVPFRNGQYA
jgi:integrase